VEADKIDYPAILVALKAKRAVIDSAIAGIEILAGEPQGSASLTFIGNLPENGVVKTPEKDIDAGILNEHAFFGMSASKGAQKYLNIRKKHLLLRRFILCSETTINTILMLLFFWQKRLALAMKKLYPL